MNEGELFKCLGPYKLFEVKAREQSGPTHTRGSASSPHQERNRSDTERLTDRWIENECESVTEHSKWVFVSWQAHLRLCLTSHSAYLSAIWLDGPCRNHAPIKRYLAQAWRWKKKLVLMAAQLYEHILHPHYEDKSTHWGNTPKLKTLVTVGDSYPHTLWVTLALLWKKTTESSLEAPHTIVNHKQHGTIVKEEAHCKHYKEERGEIS